MSSLYESKIVNDQTVSEQFKRYFYISQVFLKIIPLARLPIYVKPVTWYGLFTEKGEESEVVDVMQYLWSGTWPKNKAPHLYSLQIDRKRAVNNVYLKPGNSYSLLAVAADPDNDKLSYRWELLPEPTQVGEGGDYEARPKPVENLLSGITNDGQGILKAPDKGGAYRLFVYVTDGNNNVATANLPFYVKKAYY